MSGTPLRKLARELGISKERLKSELAATGTSVSSDDEFVSGQQQLKIFKRLQEGSVLSPSRTPVSASEIHSAGDLIELNELLTRAMAERTIQAVIKDSSLETVVHCVIGLNTEPKDELFAAAILGRLAAVARGREQTVFDRANEVVSVTADKLSIESLSDGDSKQYAAQVLTHVSWDWVADYAYREALTIDTADNARRELLAANLAREASVSAWISAITSQASLLKTIDNPETRSKRVRRIFAVMREVAQVWRGDVGANVGERLAECLKEFLSSKLAELNEDAVFDAMDHLLAILRRVIELRFSHALEGATYELLLQGKKLVGTIAWGSFLNRSAVISEIRVSLLEAALVRARQNRQHKELLSCLAACFSSGAHASSAIKQHFHDARDLDPDVAKWWLTAGSAEGTQRHVEHKVGNNEDGQIGALLIEVESNREAMDKVGRSVVPLLEISEPVLATTVKKAVDGYEAIAQTAKRLARMRKLTKTELKGEHLEYNPLEHEMLGGHRPGVRRVKVVRDGIKKEFAGKTKTLVKPWVESDEE